MPQPPPFPDMMKANRVHQYGGPEAITFEEIPVTLPAPGEVLVRVHAAGVGPWDARRASGLERFAVYARRCHLWCN
jgi:NADPH:quinone reductase-like Zn-dependent oxidoreductase